jgi:hypothetical protein
MAWSIFTNGGGDPAAVAWAKALLTKIGAPVTPANTQVIYDWEVSEGGGGKYNPLNQGPVPGAPNLTTTGQQYGGGAADYASVAAGLEGAAAYLSMPNFAAIKQDLIAGNAQGARGAIIASPWAASHYGGGSAFATKALPNGSQSITAADLKNGYAVTASGQILHGTQDSKYANSANDLNINPKNWLGIDLGPASALFQTAGWERIGFILAGAILFLMGMAVFISASKTGSNLASKVLP